MYFIVLNGCFDSLTAGIPTFAYNLNTPLAPAGKSQKLSSERKVGFFRSFLERMKHKSCFIACSLFWKPPERGHREMKAWLMGWKESGYWTNMAVFCHIPLASIFNLLNINQRLRIQYNRVQSEYFFKIIITYYYYLANAGKKYISYLICIFPT